MPIKLRCNYLLNKQDGWVFWPGVVVNRKRSGTSGLCSLWQRICVPGRSTQYILIVKWDFFLRKPFPSLLERKWKFWYIQ